MGEDPVPQTRRRRTRTPLWQPSGFWDRPPGWVFHSAVLVTCLWLLTCLSLPGGSEWTVLALLSLFVVALLWGGRLAVCVIRRIRGIEARVEVSPWRWSIAPALACLAMVGSDWPLLLRFRWSRAALDRTADMILASPDYVRGETWKPHTEDLRAGHFVVGYREALPSGARFEVVGTGLFLSLGWHGFARFPKGLPPPEEGAAYWHLEDDWYVWMQILD